jgi:ABC-type Na+ transport system ATPase subunit NatA
MDDDAIRTCRLTKYYGGRKVVDTLDLRVPRGTVYGLLGRNGAGKSTTLKILAGMVRPDSGRAEVLGEDVDALSPATRARVAYLAEGHPLYTWMTVRQAVAFTTAFYPGCNRALVEQVLDHFALSPRARIGRLSKGQRAQVSLALAIAPDPELLILDDPTLGLDANVRRDFLESMILRRRAAAPAAGGRAARRLAGRHAARAGVRRLRAPAAGRRRGAGAAARRRQRAEPGGRVHRVHPRAAAAATALPRGTGGRFRRAEP